MQTSAQICLSDCDDSPCTSLPKLQVLARTLIRLQFCRTISARAFPDFIYPAFVTLSGIRLPIANKVTQQCQQFALVQQPHLCNKTGQVGSRNNKKKNLFSEGVFHLASHWAGTEFLCVALGSQIWCRV